MSFFEGNSSLLIIVSLFLPIAPKALSGEFCGSKEGYVNQLTSTILIPDYFPPETEALRELVSNADYERCSKITYVPLGFSCQAHDACYDQQLPKDQCDRSLQDGWIKQCRSVYYKLTFDHVACRVACEAFAKLMSEAQRYDGNGFCPSCEAYANAQN